MIDELKKKFIENYNSVAYQYNNKTITYKELYDDACKYALVLKKQGTEPVIILGNNEIDELVAIMACLFAKRTYVPVGCCTPLNRLKKIISLTNSSLIITGENINIDNIHISKLSNLDMYNNLPERENNNDVAYIIFTSGSTGNPKGVPISYENLSNFIRWISSFNPLSKYKNINVFNQASFSFDLSVAAIYYGLFNGHTIIGGNIDLDNNYSNILDMLSNTNLMVITPTFIKLCLLDLEFDCSNYPNLDCIYFCGEQLESKVVKKLFKRFPNIKIINAYGPTEATSAISAVLITKEMLDESLLPVGDINNLATPVEIIDDEIVLSGKSVSKGYINDFKGGFYDNDLNHYYKTGDMGYIMNNYLYCKGRIDNQIKYKGYRIELNE